MMEAGSGKQENGSGKDLRHCRRPRRKSIEDEISPKAEWDADLVCDANGR
jgi:hypothetical protein